VPPERIAKADHEVIRSALKRDFSYAGGVDQVIGLSKSIRNLLAS
jgi:hypothetical protein